jgi:hypothetical protein
MGSADLRYAIIKIRIVNLFPYPDIFQRIPITQSVGYEKIPVFGTNHIRYTDVILVINLNDCYFSTPHIYLCHLVSTFNFIVAKVQLLPMRKAFIATSWIRR